jgi:hypothetical protein
MAAGHIVRSPQHGLAALAVVAVAFFQLGYWYAPGAGTECDYGTTVPAAGDKLLRGDAGGPTAERKGQPVMSRPPRSPHAAARAATQQSPRIDEHTLLVQNVPPPPPPPLLQKAQRTSDNSIAQDHISCADNINTACEPIVIMITLNSAFFEMFTNWLMHFQALKLDIPLIVVAEDNEVSAKIQSMTPNPATEIWRSDLNIVGTTQWGDDDYKVLMKNRVTHFVRALEEFEYQSTRTHAMNIHTVNI